MLIRRSLRLLRCVCGGCSQVTVAVAGSDCAVGVDVDLSGNVSPRQHDFLYMEDLVVLDTEALWCDAMAVDALSRGESPVESDPVLERLAEWRTAVWAQPVPDVVGLEEALTVISRARRSRVRGWPLVMDLLEVVIYTLLVLVVLTLGLGL